MNALTSPAQREAASPTPASSAHTKRPTRRTGAFTSPSARRRWWILFGAMCVVTRPGPGRMVARPLVKRP